MGRLFLAEEITKKICTRLHHPHCEKRQRANLRCGTSMHKTAKAKLFVMKRTVFIIYNMMNQPSTKIMAVAYAMSDNEAAERLQQARQTLFQTIVEQDRKQA